MRKFWCYVSNETYSVGCTGQTVYVYDKEGKELAKFKDIKYGYKAVFSPTQNIFIVKSTGAYFAVYSLDTMSLIKKVKYSNIDASQDDGYCFSKDGTYFYNIERQKSSTNSAISIYDTSTFERVNIFLEDNQKIEPSYIEYDEHGQIYVFGFLRGDTGVISDGFVSKCNENGLEDVLTISKEDYEYYHNFKSLEIKGFTEKAKEWSGFKYKNVDMTGMENMKFPLSELWKKYKNIVLELGD